MPTLAELIKEARERKGWTQQQLANAIGVSGHTVFRLENEKVKDPSLLSILRIWQLLNMPMAELGQLVDVNLEDVEREPNIYEKVNRLESEVRRIKEEGPTYETPNHVDHAVVDFLLTDEGQRVQQGIKKALEDPEKRKALIVLVESLSK